MSFSTLRNAVLLGCLSVWLVACAAPSQVPASHGSGVAQRQAVDASVSLNVVDVEGQSHDLDKSLSEGRNVAVVFWQPWCLSCREESVHLIPTCERLLGEVDFISVVSGPDGSVDEEHVGKAIAEWGLNYPVVRDRDLSLTKALKVDAAPTLVILGEGREVLYHANVAPAGWE